MSVPPIDPRVRIGHVHLKVADLDRALGFYQGVLGFELTQRYGRDAAFVAAGGYHHHIGLNVWESRGGSPPPRGTTGLYHLAILYPTRAALADAPRRSSLALRMGAHRRGDSARRRERPRGQRGAVPARPGRQRRRALPRPAAGGVAAGRRGEHRDDDAALGRRGSSAGVMQALTGGCSWLSRRPGGPGSRPPRAAGASHRAARPRTAARRDRSGRDSTPARRRPRSRPRGRSRHS